MRIILFIFASSMFLNLSGRDQFWFRQCGDMILSDALPVQFWLSNCDTFNEYLAQGVHPACWCQPWNCADEIVTQFSDDTGSNYSLQIVSEDDVIIDSLLFTEVQAGVYQLAFIPEEISGDLCDARISLRIVDAFSVVQAKSDCLEIAESQDETIFIEYSNKRNYAGLIYANDSPDTTFGIRVPCRFVHENEPEEDEAMELTSSIITTSSQIKTQRLLEVKHAPYYFHKKLRRVLKHQTIVIFNKQWEKEEKYEQNEGNKQWLLKSATCLLTEKNSVVRNVL